MDYQATFQRYEIKYLLNVQDKQELFRILDRHMRLDDYGRTTIRNVYYDTDNYRLIRRSLEKPAYKEKLRIRSYRQSGPGDPVFVELKKKYRSVVYKRRLTLSRSEAEKCFRTGGPLPVHSQIAEEIDYFRDYYGSLHPAMFLSYEREAYEPLDGSDFRVTFDENILCRRQDLSLGSSIYGTPLLLPGQTLMELKTSGGIPLWMSHFLNAHHLFQTSYSKYGMAYTRQVAARMQAAADRRCCHV